MGLGEIKARRVTVGDAPFHTQSTIDDEGHIGVGAKRVPNGWAAGGFHQGGVTGVTPVVFVLKDSTDASYAQQEVFLKAPSAPLTPNNDGSYFAESSADNVFCICRDSKGILFFLPVRFSQRAVFNEDPTNRSGTPYAHGFDIIANGSSQIAFALRSTECAHGITSIAPTDVCMITAAGGDGDYTHGGVTEKFISDGDYIPHTEENIVGSTSVTFPAKATKALKKNGAIIQAIASTEKIEGWYNNTAEKVAIYGNGDIVSQGTQIALPNVRTVEDPNTGEKGDQIRVLNRKGSASVKGELLTNSPTYDNAYVPQSNMYDTCYVCAESGVADGAMMWVWKLGGHIQMLMENGQSSTRGYLAKAAPTDGRVLFVPNPGSGLPGTDEHFKEVGHCAESRSSGTDVLVLVDCHYN